MPGDPTTRGYDALYRAGGFGYEAKRGYWRRWVRRHYVRSFRLRPSFWFLRRRRRLLDIPCGDGFWTSLLHRLGLRVVGVDLSPEGVAQARGQHPRIRFEVGDAEGGLPFPEGHFDVVFSRGITHLHHDLLMVDRTIAMTRNLMRYVAPDGLLLVSYYTLRDGEGAPRHRYHPVSHLAELFEQCGDVVRIEVVGNLVQIGVRHR